MEFSKLVEAFEAHTGLSGQPDAAVLAIWFNEAQADLALDLGPVKRLDFAAGAAEYDLPADFLALIEGSCTLTPDNKLRFAAAAPRTIYYRALPAFFDGVDTSQESELDPALHALLPLWAASRYWDQESEGDYEESGHANKWMNYYLQAKQQATKRLARRGGGLERWQIVE